MTLPVRLDEHAEREIEDAAQYYEARRAGLGESFLSQVQASIEQLQEAPEACSPVAGTAVHELRSARVGRFPYRVIFARRPAELLVVAVAHDRRQTSYWRERLDE